MNQARHTTSPPPRRTRRPRLSDEIRDAILNDLLLSGQVSPGDRLPTEAELCRIYSASRVTVRAALRSLKDAGFIAIRQGQGSTVLPRSRTLPSGLDQLSSLETYAANQGAQVSSSLLAIQERELTVSEAKPFGQAMDARYLVIQRAKVYDNDRVAWMIDYVPEGVLPFEQIRAEFTGSVLDVLLAHPELAIDHSDCDLDAVPLPEDIAAKLKAQPGSPSLFLDELTRNTEGSIVNRSVAWLRPSHFNFSLRRRRPFGQ